MTRRLLGPGLVLLLLAAAERPLDAQTYHLTGRWWGPFIWDANSGDCETATHLVSLRGRGDTTVVLHLNGTAPSSPTCSNSSPRVLLIPPGQVIRGTQWDSLPQTHVPAVTGEPNLFCCGHASMSDGKVLFVGGTSIGTNGHKGVQVFEPKLYFHPDTTVGGVQYKHGWAAVDTMKRERWYPTTTPLPDGRILVSSGLRHYEVVHHGGMRDTTNAVAKKPDIMAMRKYAAWTRVNSIGDTRYRTEPTERQDHTMVYSADAKMHDNDGGGVVIVYGGRDPQGTVLNECWIGWRVGFDEGEPYSWIRGGSSLWPSGFVGRYEHSAVAVPGAFFNSGAAILYGGKTGAHDSTTTSELWKLTFQVVGGSDAANDTVIVEQVTNATGTSPGRRYGHTAVLDEYLDGATTKRRMLVFGGRTHTGALADDAVYSLDLSAATPAWSIVEPASAGNIRARYAHSAIMDGPAAYLASAKPRRMVVFGGIDSAGLTRSIAVLKRCNNAASCQDSYDWESPTIVDSIAARAHHTAVYDREWNRMMVFGGDLTGNSGYTAEAFTVSLDHAATSPYGTTIDWVPMPLDSGGTDIEARGRHASVWNPRYVVEKLAEIYDPSKPSGQRWKDVTGAPIYDQWTYPFYFLLPSGNVLYAGRNTRTPFTDGSSLNNSGTRILNTASSTDPANWSWSSQRRPSIIGGSGAVMFEPGRIMKFGQPVSNPTQGHASVARLDLSSSDTATPDTIWVEQGAALDPDDRPYPRIESNLTMVPDGRVLVSGGRSKHEDNGDAYKAPQFWNPADGLWTTRGNLAEDPSTRGYHSTAILTPDAKLLSAGGSHLNSPDVSKGLDMLGEFTLFDPPYLYSGATTLAARPAWTGNGHPQRLGHGQRFTVCVDSAATIARVVLIKPGATTHAFNMDQRYVPLSFTRVGGSSPRLHVSAPATANLAPPGDYLLFTVDSSGTRRVPSVGKWLQMWSSTGDDLCDATAPPKATTVQACYDQPTNRVNLTWTGVEDDTAATSTGTPVEVEFRYKVGSGITNESAWSSATVITLTDDSAPAPGTEVTRSFTPNEEGTFYIRMKTRDDNGNWSTMSNQVTLVVDSEEFTECVEGGGGGGGGGGGSNARRDPGALAMLPGGGGPQLPNGNSLLQRPVAGSLTDDLLRLHFDPSSGGGSATAWVAPAATGTMEVDRLRLMVLDHAEDREALVLDGAVVTAAVHEPQAVLSEGGDTLAAPGVAPLETGEAVVVDLGARTHLLVEAARSATYRSGQRNGLLVQREVEGVWQTVARVVPRRVAEPVAVAAGAGRLRLLAQEDLTIVRLAALTTVEAATPGLAAFSAPYDGESESLANADSSLVSLTDGAAAGASFLAPEQASGSVRTWFLAVRARVGTGGAGALRAGRAAEPSVLAFALHQNQPNPFHGGTAVSFDLPRGERVSLEVHDLAGRRVASLMDGWRPPGRHTVRWDQRDRAGNLVRAGVYLYRLRASGSGVVERKLVVLP